MVQCRRNKEKEKLLCVSSPYACVNTAILAFANITKAYLACPHADQRLILSSPSDTHQSLQSPVGGMPAGDYFCKGVYLMLPIIDVEATAQRIDSRRIENHLTVRDLQNVFGFSSPQAVYGWIRAKSVPSVDNLVVLASVLHTTLDDLIITTN